MTRWVWDRRKAAANKRQYGVSFELAERVFGDPMHLARLDDGADEERWLTIGRPGFDSDLLVLVVHTAPDGEGGTGRIISARRATWKERDAYEEGEL